MEGCYFHHFAQSPQRRSERQYALLVAHSDFQAVRSYLPSAANVRVQLAMNVWCLEPDERQMAVQKAIHCQVFLGCFGAGVSKLDAEEHFRRKPSVSKCLIVA